MDYCNKHGEYSPRASIESLLQTSSDRIFTGVPFSRHNHVIFWELLVLKAQLLKNGIKIIITNYVNITPRLVWTK